MYLDYVTGTLIVLWLVIIIGTAVISIWRITSDVYHRNYVLKQRCPVPLIVGFSLVLTMTCIITGHLIYFYHYVQSG